MSVIPQTHSPTQNLPPAQFSQRWEWGSNQPISFLMQQAVANPDCISLAAGLVDQGSLPAELVRRATREMLADDRRAQSALQYGTTAGFDALRRILMNRLATLEGVSPGELGIDEDQLVLTTGSQQLLSVVGEVLVDPGDIVFVAAPTYFVFLGTLNGQGARIVPVETDDDGMRPEALEAQLERIAAAGELDRVKLIYLVSYYENPSGISLAEERRAAIVDVARRWSKNQKIFILEDAAYRELRYDGPELPSVWSCDPTHETVILANTFSKTFSPGLRIGWGVLPAELVGPICDRKGNEDFGSANFNQHLLAAVFELDLYDEHLERLRSTYRTKRDCTLDAADKYFSGLAGVHWVHPHGGLYVWMTLPEGCDAGLDSPLFREAVKNQGVMYVPGEFSYVAEPDQQPKNQIRISYGVQEPAGIDTGMQRLARAVETVLG